jgi:hypothetical protein
LGLRWSEEQSRSIRPHQNRISGIDRRFEVSISRHARERLHSTPTNERLAVAARPRDWRRVVPASSNYLVADEPLNEGIAMRLLKPRQKLCPARRVFWMSNIQSL